VLKYLARYTHRVAISNQRLLQLKDGQVHFQWKDYAHGHAERAMALDAVEFVRRFLLHVLPNGFVHIRHYCFLANRSREEKLPLCRRLIAAGRQVPAPAEAPGPVSMPADGTTVTGLRVVPEAELRLRCPQCGRGPMVIIEFWEPSELDMEEGETLTGARSNPS
jgi:Putative transposase